MSDKKAAVIGLGNMGLGMAQSLARAGFQVTGFDPSEAACAAASAAGVASAKSAAEAAAGAQFVVLSLPTSAIVKQLLAGPAGLLAVMAPGSMVIDTTSGDPKSSRDVADEAKSGGRAYLDAPVSGGAAGARKGELTMFIGGSKDDVAKAEPALSAMGTKRFHVGDVGAGCVAKIVNNLLVASHLLTASEAFKLAEAAGVQTAHLIDAINAGSGRSGVTLYNYPARILNGGFDSGFTVKLMRKDVNLAMSLMEEVGVELPMSTITGKAWNGSAEHLQDNDDFNRIVTIPGVKA